MRRHGFIDLHTHGFGRYDTRTADPEDIFMMAELHGKAGTAAILPTIYSSSIGEMRENMEAVRRAMIMQSAKCKMQNVKSGSSESAIRNLQSAIILGVHLEGPFLNPARCGALEKDSFIKPTASSLGKLIEGYEDIIGIITVAPELPGALKVIERCSELGIKVNMGHSDATYREAMNGKSAGASGITHLFNAMRPFHHREPGLAGFGLLDKDIYVEVIADGAHLSREALKLIFALKRNDRILLVSDSVKGAKKGGKPVYKARGILAGGGLSIADSVGVLKGIGVPLKGIVEGGMHNPRKALDKKFRLW